MHHCKYLLIRCKDFRLGKSVKEYLEKEGILGDCDEVSIAGGVKDNEFVLKEVGSSITLHNIEEVIFCNHTDCGAYGGSGASASFEEECEFHAEELKNIKGMILAKHPFLTVKMILGKILPSGEVILEEINT